ncbi:hypothetical protein A3B21_01895 [Candidatus Uhrbacteria bacterium RIFCSPLOWO2_01_FULL_47_24]|uniref:Dephospho-CoA kinase n=1 Tax=Candidatus Uhrbacteria bacterium RIFCSPLOWO2_01_FULL_47_24 TaxID=1802401 RepID=A0A1F7UR04_9BACT|nr:MAG: hypothetical protein A2753_01645 [Candidatus Uhrbacteria bacterium RIFCSPHIGHO2_01_FULL_47_11]OGL67921.1 MAG: hypothetical protein A3D58_05090 [Candidatus Uhrbacteria bacterium RIFCSPHIGHO2_02_FULL_46_47]OGL75192.1 MAG: hypothetical protein A3F52_04080 [Candidatus Uhrbacteria bacterium RIFCSPHIGHO2_12_FULL_47_11]OGL80107.1 MAG: hypothetical protein A3B21_01895 [Candidatus Uhrbacteria bacterium RIFCSPLOWO2_01_FULL_47_24]OGL84893.1 MAG: hypothetical protein A3J03_04280 [Candidatus Uhrbact
MVIGITGTTGAGKDTIADYLKTLGFAYHSLSDIIRDECAKKNIPLDRDNLIAMGNELRGKLGPGVLGKLTAEKIQNLGETKAIAVSIRNPAEVAELKKMPGFFLISVDAPIDIRYNRIKTRGRIEDSVTFEKFKAQEETELAGSANQQQLNNVMTLADFRIKNDETFENLHRRVDEILKKT